MEASQADLLITNRLRDALALLDVRVLDHVIIGGQGQWMSMSNQGFI
jgi:DNA repair protein RadC